MDNESTPDFCAVNTNILCKWL